ncbi:FliH/SctL family protein [Nesterenkonia lutea]|uniref:Flagellar assembly protein FliH n=1 Tax=Nesterenkonia lutea TaxID=272919 RepID=A0ABR9JFD5_9MICC|nr:FliH/SctL family protein [Nesterenkonia lutea]MBE1524641.1 flagellar assembly protein FliH [Nesterenkonia lutea]
MSSDTTFPAEASCPAETSEVHLLDFGAYGHPKATEAAYAGARTHGYAAGYAAGMRAASEAARQQREQLQARAVASAQESAAALRAAIAGLDAAARALQRQVTPVVESAQKSLVDAGLELAEAIVGTELLQGPHSARAALARVLAELEPADVRRVRMHPDTLAQLPKDAAELAGTRILPDATLHPGDAVADLPEGFLDARISTALHRCRAALQAHRAQHEGSGQTL